MVIVKKTIEEAQKAQVLYKAGLGKVFAYCHGKSTTFAIFFSLNGAVLAYLGKLTPEFVALVGAIHGLIVWRSKQDDKHEENMAGAPQ